MKKPRNEITSAIHYEAGRNQRFPSPLISLAGQQNQSTGHSISGDAADQVTKYVYDGNGDVLTMEAVESVGNNQFTNYVYGFTPSNGSDLFSNDLLYPVQYPDPSTGAASSDSANQQTYGYDALGEEIGYTDQNGSTHTYGYDVLGRKISDVVSTLGSGVNGSVRALAYAYDELGLPYTQTSYSDTSMSTLVNQVMEHYNDLGQLIAQYQSDSIITPLYPPEQTDYAYTDLADGNNSRLVSMTYPNGRVEDYLYSTTLDSAISRVDGIADDGGSAAGTLVSYSYLGLGTIVQETFGSGDTLSYISQSGDSDVLPTGTITSGGDQYTGLDRFDRVVDQNYFNTSTGTTIARWQYGYDANSNVLFKADLVTASNSELYTYDDFSRLISFQRGTLSSSDTSISGTPSVNETWSLDSLGNWVSNTVGGSTTDDTTNSQNELTAVGGRSETFDNDGNTLTDSSGNTYTYNAWNEMATVTIGSMEVVYSYDALGRRVSMAGPGTGALVAQYYSADGQLIETDPNGDPFATGSVVQSQYVWGLNGPNDLVVADVTGGGDLGIDSAGLNTRIYSINDANHDVMATADTTGAVMLRYMYDPYGTRMGGGGPYDIQVGFQGGIIDPFTGFDRFGVRDENTVTGRWMEQDPTGWRFINGPNLYQLEISDPVGLLDPSGKGASHFFGHVFLAAAAATDGVAASIIYPVAIVGSIPAGVITTFAKPSNGKGNATVQVHHAFGDFISGEFKDVAKNLKESVQ